MKSANELYRIVADPAGKRFEVEASDAFVDVAGAPPGFDIDFLIRALARRRRGTSWQVVVRDAGSSQATALIRHVGSKEEARLVVAHLADAITAGELPDGDEQVPDIS